MYYPKSQVKTNQYSNFDLEDKFTGTPYEGYYYQTSSGKYFSGKNPQVVPSIELVPIKKETTSVEESSTNRLINSFETDQYLKAKKTTFVTQKIPSYYHPIPTQEDYNLGSFVRYFCKKANQTIYIEINKDTFDKLESGSPEYNNKLYIPFKLTWALTGTSSREVNEINLSVVSTTERQLRLQGLVQYFKNYSQYYLG